MKKTAAPKKGPNLRSFSVFVEGEHYSVEVEEVGGKPFVRTIGAAPQPKSAASPKPAAKPEPAEPKAHSERQTAAPTPPAASARLSAAGIDSASLGDGEYGVFAPMPGLLISFTVKVGSKVKVNDTICILEAMKMQNNLPSPIAGTVKRLCATEGSVAEMNQLLAVIAQE